MFGNILLKVKKWAIPVIAALIVVVGGLTVWVNTTFQGQLWFDKMTNQRTPPPENHCIKVYSAGELVGDYDGHYSVEQFDDHIVLINHDKHDDKTEIYGETAVIVDED